MGTTRSLMAYTLGPTLLLATLALSVAYGVTAINPRDVVQAFVAFDGSSEHYIIRTVRLPRALIAMGVGSSLAVAGALMQALTRNPLASPSIFGVNAGASFAVVLGIFLFGSSSLTANVWFAFLGSAAGALVIYVLASFGGGGLTPMKLAVAGAAITALLTSVTQGLLILNERTLDEIRFWLAGSVAGRGIDLFMQVLPYMAIGLVAAVLMARQVTTLSLGEDVARGLGQNTALLKTAALAIVVLLAGSSVAVAGPVGFVGLAVPHITRSLVGTDYRRIIPHAAILGAILLLLADVGSRWVINPQELPIGVMTAAFGAPFFIYLARREAKRS